MEEKSSLFAYGFSGVVLAVLVITEIFYRQPLFDMSLQWIPALQMHASSAQIEFWKIWTDYGLIVVQAAPLAIFYINPKQRVRFFYYLVLFSFVMLVMNVTKLSYSDPRPYWVASDIIAFKCSN
jgi:hypothetical protein